MTFGTTTRRECRELPGSGGELSKEEARGMSLSEMGIKIAAAPQ